MSVRSILEGCLRVQNRSSFYVFASFSTKRLAATYLTRRTLVTSCRTRRNCLPFTASEQDFLDIDDAEPALVWKKIMHCYGCGIEVQTRDKDEVGYIDKQKLDTKLAHNQLGQLLCNRCIRLTQGELVAGVDDVRVKKETQPLKRLISPDDLRDQLKSVHSKKVVVVLLVDLLDLPGSILTSIRPLIGMNPILLVGTKVDLLPKKADLEQVREWLQQYVIAKKLNVIDTHLVSNRRRTGISKATRSILRTRNGRDIYVMGLANVGKSAFVRALLTEMQSFTSTNFTADAVAKGRFMPVESSMPGTTLGLIKIRALKGKRAIYDTPGVHVFHRLTHLLRPDKLRRILPKRSLSPYIAPTPYEIAKQIAQATALVALDADADRETIIEQIAKEPEEISATYFWGGLARIDIYETPPTTSIVFYGSSVLQVHAFPLLRPQIHDLASNSDVNAAVLNGELMDCEIGTHYLSDIPSLNEYTRSTTATDVSDLEYDPFEDLSQMLDTTAREPATVLESFTDEEEEIKEIDVETAFFGGDSVLESGGLVVAKEFEIDCLGFEEPLVDISISGLPGWVSVVLPRSHKGNDKGVLRGRIWTPRGVEAFLRTPIPVRNPLLKSPQF